MPTSDETSKPLKPTVAQIEEALKIISPKRAAMRQKFRDEQMMKRAREAMQKNTPLQAFLRYQVEII